MGILDSSLVRRMGLFASMFGRSKRDLYSVFGYIAAPTYRDKLLKYLRQDIAGRVVDAPAAALWSNPPVITSNNPEWDTAWKDLETKYNIFASIEKADRLAGIGAFAIMIIGLNDGKALSEAIETRSLKQRKNGDKILFLQAYGEGCVKIKTFNTDSSSSDFMKPLIYTVDPNGVDNALAQNVGGFLGAKDADKNHRIGSFDVHASRVIHVAECTLENEVYGNPRLERTFNLLDDLQKVVGGTAETFWLTSNRGLHIDIDKEMEIDPEDAKNLSDEIDEYTNQLRRIIRTRGTKITSLGSDVPDPRGVFSIIISSISGATGIPQRILIGSEAGQLASEQDRANWAERIKERRNLWANPVVIHQIIKKLTRAGYLPAPENIEITIDWPSAFQMSPLEAAQTSAQHARSAANFAKVFDTFEALRKGTPGTPEQKLPDGTVVPGTADQPGSDIGDLVTIDEARQFIGLDKKAITFDSSHDVT